MLDRCQISFRRLGRSVVVSLSGALDGAAAHRLYPLLLDVIEGQGNMGVVIDRSGLHEIDATAASVLSDAEARAARLQAGLCLV